MINNCLNSAGEALQVKQVSNVLILYSNSIHPSHALSTLLFHLMLPVYIFLHPSLSPIYLLSSTMQAQCSKSAQHLPLSFITILTNPLILIQPTPYLPVSVLNSVVPPLNVINILLCHLQSISNTCCLLYLYNDGIPNS